MKKLTLLPVLCLALAVSGCHLIDDDIDLPEPEKPLEERIQGIWHNYETISTRYSEYGEAGGTAEVGDYGLYDFYGDKVTVFYLEHTFEGRDYDIFERGGTTYIGIGDVTGDTEDYNYYPYREYEFVSINDSTMLWAYEFSTRVKNPDGQVRNYTDRLEYRFRKRYR